MLLRSTIAALVLAAAPLEAQFAYVDSTVTREMRANNVPGAAIAIVQGDRILYAKGYGVGNAERRDAVTADMLFRISSMTKMFTGLVAARLVENGLDLDRRIGDIDGELPPGIADLTLRQLLSHTAGLRDESAAGEQSLATAARGITATDFFTTPRDIYSYSNLDYTLAGYIESVFAKKSYPEIVSELILKPLKMTTSTFDLRFAATYPLAAGHSNLGKVVRPFTESGAMLPRGGLFSSAQDIARFAIALLNDTALSRAVALVTTPIATAPGDSLQYGLGMRIARRNEWGHYGGSTGFGSYLRILPREKVAVVVLTNRTNAILDHVADTVFAHVAHVQRRAARVSSPQPVSAARVRDIAGRYLNGKQELLLEEREGRLFFIDEGEPIVVKSRGPGNIVLMDGETVVQEIAVVPAVGQPKYLYLFGRAFRRQ